jgi:hypothetical protein
MGTETHPVWGVYDLLRTARLNVKYYSGRLHRAESCMFWMDLSLLITAPSSAIARLWFWQDPVGQIVWKYLGAIAAFIAIIKPLLGLTKKIKGYQELRSGYTVLEYDLRQIKEMIAHNRKYDKPLQEEFKKAFTRHGILASKEPDTKESKHLKNRCVNEVKKELPLDSFYIPEED